MKDILRMISDYPGTCPEFQDNDSNLRPIDNHQQDTCVKEKSTEP